METLLEAVEIETHQNNIEEKQLYSIEEVLEHIDSKFVNFYGEYGRKIVNNRRMEFNQDGMVNLNML